MGDDIPSTKQMTVLHPHGPEDAGAPPSSAWVRFLRSYGPTPQNLTMFDEYVSGAAGRSGVQPIRLSTTESVSEALLCIRRQVEICEHGALPGYFLFLDWKTAFDAIERASLLNDDKTIPATMSLHFEIADLYTFSTFQVKSKHLGL